MQWECRFMWNFATISWKSLEKKYVSPIFRSDRTFLRWHYALSIIRLLLRHQPWLLSVWISNKICLIQWGHRLMWNFLAISWSSLEKKHVGPIVRSDRKFLQWHYSALSPRGGVLRISSDGDYQIVAKKNLLKNCQLESWVWRLRRGLEECFSSPLA